MGWSVLPNIQIERLRQRPGWLNLALTSAVYVTASTKLSRKIQRCQIHIIRVLEEWNWLLLQ